MTSSRDKILNKLRAAQQPFPDAPPRPKQYVPVTRLEDESLGALLARFREELERLDGEVFDVENDAAARACVVDLLQGHRAESVLAWGLEHIHVEGLATALGDANIQHRTLDIHQDQRQAILESGAQIPVGLTGAEAAFATTGTLLVQAAPGQDRIPTVLPRVHIVIISRDQILPRIESWVAQQRENDLSLITNSTNLCFITGPSRTADIEKKLVLGMHGPERLQVIIKRSNG